jgi:PIN domain nuclease of toxin-antitoxin system
LRLLLDTHVILWGGSAPEKLADHVRAAIVDAEVLFVSVVSAWEYGLKRRKHPERLPYPFSELLGQAPLEPLGLEFACHVYSETLPPLHADPFDRMLIAQALHHKLTLVTGDEQLGRYEVPILW